MNYPACALATSLILLGIGCGGTDAGGERGADADGVLVSMRGRSITEANFKEEMNKISPFAQNQFSGAEGKKRMLDRMIQNEILYMAARDKGYQNSPEVRDQLEEYERNLLIREYYRSEVQERVAVDDDAIRNFYDVNPDKYTEKARVKVRHILSKSAETASELRSRAVAGNDFKALAREHSTDKLSAKRDGLLGNIIQNGYIPTIGKDDAIQDVLFSMSAQEISEPVQSKKGYHLFLVEERTEARTKPIQEVEELIRGELKRQLLSDAMDDQLEQLKDHYQVKVFVEKLGDDNTPATGEFEFKLENVEEESPGADEIPPGHGAVDARRLLQLASSERDPHTAIRTYSAILKQFPGDPLAYKAQFMIGFIESEQLENNVAAISAFRRLLKNYPECELAESARYMIAELGRDETSLLDMSHTATG